MAFILLYMSDQVLALGLYLAGIGATRQDRVKRETNLEDFKSIYGIHPLVVAQIWEDL